MRLRRGERAARGLQKKKLQCGCVGRGACGEGMQEKKLQRGCVGWGACSEGVAEKEAAVRLRRAGSVRRGDAGKEAAARLCRVGSVQRGGLQNGKTQENKSGQRNRAEMLHSDRGRERKAGRQTHHREGEAKREEWG